MILCLFLKGVNMENKGKSGAWHTFTIWFGLGALMFGTYCGANMASGVYASQYIVTLGGGWALVWLLIFFAAMSFFCVTGLNFVRAYKVSNYNSYYLALYGLEKPDSNPTLKLIVTIFFDIYSTMMGLVTVGATIALFSQLMNQLFGISNTVASIGGVLLFAALTVNGAGFLRKFNGVMTVTLIVSLVAIMIAVFAIRGDVIAARVGNFEEGPNWGVSTVGAHLSMFLAYCATCSQWGSSLSNYGDRLRNQKDAIGSGIMIGALVTLLFVMTGIIVLPFMPDVISDSAPILTICQKYLPPVLTAVYWVVVVFSVVSTAPSFTFNFTNRWATVWKSDKVSHRMKFFILSTGYLLVCWFISRVGLIAIVNKGYTLLGKIALPTIVLPLIISIPRVMKKNREEKAQQKQA